MSARTSSDASESTLQGQQSEEKVPFIDQEWRPTPSPSRERSSLLRRMMPYLALATADLVFLLLVSKLLEQRYIHGPNVVYTPAREAIQWEDKYFVLQDGWDKKYFPMEHYDGLRSAWKDLLIPMNVLYSKNEVDRFGGASERSTILPNGTYYGSNTIYHNLHCLHYIYKSLWRDRYFPELTSDEEHRLQMHNMHCLSYLKQTMECQPDLTPMIMYWPKTASMPTAQLDYPHQCVNWDKMNSWWRSRSFEPFAEGLLTHPEFGTPYGQQTGPQVGVVRLGGEETVHKHKPGDGLA
ncbi:hypothetical protein CKM354_001283000 [Cercospora kikuchii]|uniref:Cyclochlorotine biosynthesis protein O n=1 Tax=Cercospora kikuchii TaxID=84275 RepID=A0A9P3FMQ1_9PEZI|nr:uncharacterized protein CKM354_001283000 [Cercospora kikuchii]GIZ49805.1 hypothetical protein CKM354_001283000 [Cercospora kikuchii]